jgi:hypothetical protein
VRVPNLPLPCLRLSSFPSYNIALSPCVLD